MRSVLAVGAHPDDIELGCGGALAAHRAAGHTLTMLVLSDGGNGPGTADRWAEQDAAARVLDAGLVWGGLTDCGLVPDAATVTLVEKVINAVGADVVYVHAPEDSHQDHRAAWVAAEDINLTFASARWHTLVFRTRHGRQEMHRRQLELCVFTHLALDLKAGDLAVLGAEQYADYRAQLPVFSANNPPAHARETGRKSLPGAGLRVGEGVKSAR